MAVHFDRPKINPGLAGWVSVGATVLLADGYAKHRQSRGHSSTDFPTMSDEFANNYGWGVTILAGVAAHLLTHRRAPSA